MRQVTLLTPTQTSTMGQIVQVRGNLVINQDYNFAQPYFGDHLAT